jgi:drug/metabolite transporter (DMT)-like permease
VPSDAAAYALLGLAMAAYQVCYFRAVTLTGVAVAALLAICSAPLMIAILAALVLGERIEPVVKVSLGMAVVGTALLVLGPRGLGEIAGRFGAGALLALGAGLSYAVYAVTAKRVLSRTAPLPWPPSPSGSLRSSGARLALEARRAMIGSAPRRSSSTWASGPPPSPTRSSRRA